MVLALFVCSVLWVVPGDGPAEFGRSQLTQAWARAGVAPESVKAESQIDPRLGAEGFRLRAEGGRVVVEGGDAAGVMLGYLEAADWLNLNGADGLERLELTGRPRFKDRGWNVFLTLPWSYEHHQSDYAPEALTDPARWWFHEDHYWTTLFDEMAKARLNWLDLHGTYDIETTAFPNLYPYLVDVEGYSSVGVSKETKAKNLAQLRKVLALAHARGIRVSLMSYASRVEVPHAAKPKFPATEEAEYQYTRAAVERLLRDVPELDGIGFRIGETGRGAEFFRCYTEAVERSGRQIPLFTRSWLTRKAQVVPLACASDDFTVEIKWNGEHWGPPYPVAGGRVPSWSSYSFEDYLSDSLLLMPKGIVPRRMHPGRAHREGGAWPAQPYKIVWQVRANGTHRGQFSFYEPELVRSTIRTMELGAASGFSVEPLNAYYPAEPRSYTAKAEDAPARWFHERDAHYMHLWGRMGYEPNALVAPIEARLRRELGPQAADALLPRWKAASAVIPTAFTAHGLGPDHRSHAPELEPGGDARSYFDGSPFDSFVVRTRKEDAAYRELGTMDGRRSMDDFANALDQLSSRIESPSSIAEPMPSARARFWDLVNATKMLGHLSRYYSARLRGASGAAAWDRLAQSEEAAFYGKFPDRLRMGTTQFHWARAEHREGNDDAEGKRSPGKVRLGAEFQILGANYALTATESTIQASFRGAHKAWLLWKPLPISTFFHRIPMPVASGSTEARVEIPRPRAGACIAFDVEMKTLDLPGTIYRVPIDSQAPWNPDHAASHQAPYLVVPALPGPTPLYYNAEEALRFLRPESLDPEHHGLLVVGTRAWSFFRRFDRSQKLKILDAVERGMKLLILQQDFASGRYSLDWIPDAPGVRSKQPGRVSEEEGLGIREMEHRDILWQPFDPQRGWEVVADGAVARRRYGAGEIVLCQARLMQLLDVRGAASTLASLLSMGTRGKPVVLIDHGYESPDDATSTLPDMLNVLEIPFVTLGEVIAERQGVDCTEPIPGPPDERALLAGKGGESVRKWLQEKVRTAAARPVPLDRMAFEAERARRRRELLRSLGLDPLPPRTDLKARQTGTLEGDGYRIEKWIFESRPQFYVTAHVYVPEGRSASGAPGGRFPVIVNPHGHWHSKKSEPTVQARAASQARAGYVAIVVDAPGNSFGQSPDERAAQGIHDDLRLLLGSANVTALYVWDLMRAVDLLETRPDVDASRIGITGASGGGLATLFAFAADERLRVAVPAVFATSLEVQPENGCLCNHVPATLQIGDRSDILAIRAPAPVLLLGAQSDGEFPPEGHERTYRKLQAEYALLGAESKVSLKLFEGPHGYDRPMREAALGFFDLHLRGLGDGSPRPEPPFQALPGDSTSLRCLTAPLPTRTMRDLARERLQRAAEGSWEQLLALNGGMPTLPDPSMETLWERSQAGGERRRFIAVTTEAALRVPGILHSSSGASGGSPIILLISERGKAAADAELDGAAWRAKGYSTLAIDVRGFGELPGLDPRLMAYLGMSDAFAMAIDAAQVARACRKLTDRVEIAGRGPTASQIVLFAAFLEPRIAAVHGLDALASFEEALQDSVPTHAIQPRADLAPTLESLRALLGARGNWRFANSK